MDGLFKLSVIITLLHFAISCQRNLVCTAEYMSITDSKPFTDSLMKADGFQRNPRELRLIYKVENHSDKPLYLPVRTLFREDIFSHINIYIVDGSDTITPKFSVKRVPYNSDIVNIGDSAWIHVKIFNFDKWRRNHAYTDMNIFDFAKKIRAEYCKSTKDTVPSSMYWPDLIFEETPRMFYAIPPGGEWWY